MDGKCVNVLSDVVFSTFQIADKKNVKFHNL